MRFLPRDATHSPGLCRRTVSVHLYNVTPSVTFLYSIGTSQLILKLFSLSGSPAILVFRTKRYGNILTP